MNTGCEYLTLSVRVFLLYFSCDVDDIFRRGFVGQRAEINLLVREQIPLKFVQCQTQITASPVRQKSVFFLAALVYCTIKTILHFFPTSVFGHPFNTDALSVLKGCPK